MTATTSKNEATKTNTTDLNQASKTPKTGPGKSHREGVSMARLFKMFPDDDAAREWIEGIVWPDGPFCPRCGSKDVVEFKHPSMTHRCRDCRRAGESKTMFSVRVGTVLEGTKLGYQTWAIAIYLHVTSLKGVSSMRLHRDLDISQPAAWHLAHRIREGFTPGGGASDESADGKFTGPVEVDESFFGGRPRRNSPPERRRGKGHKAIVAGVIDRETGQVSAEVVPDTKGHTLQQFVVDNVEVGSVVYTDELPSYRRLGRYWYHHESVKHSVGEYVRDQAHTNGIESFWSVLKRAYNGTYHKLSHKHLDRYVSEFVGRHNARDLDTLEQMEALVVGMRGKRLRYEDLVADNGLKSGARGR